MSDLQFVFTKNDNTKDFPLPIKDKYQLISLEIEAENKEGLASAVRNMRIYFLFIFGTPNNTHAFSFKLSDYVFALDALNYTIEFEDDFLVLDPKATCTQARVSIVDEVITPVFKMTLIIKELN